MKIPDNPAATFFKVWAETLQSASSSEDVSSSSRSPTNFLENFLNNKELFADLSQSAVDLHQAFYSDDIDPEALKKLSSTLSRSYANLYQHTFGRLLGIPHLGLTREHAQKITAALDAYNKFVGVLSDFCLKFNIPLTDSLKIFQSTIKDKPIDEMDGRSLYNQLVQTLDIQYDRFLKSPEGVECVVAVVNSYLDFEKELKPIKALWARMLSLPTQAEMEEVYHNIYLLKKKTRAQEKMIKNQAAQIDQLNLKIENLDKQLFRPKAIRKTAKRKAPKPTTARGSTKKRTK